MQVAEGEKYIGGLTQDQILHATVLSFFHDIPNGVLMP